MDSDQHMKLTCLKPPLTLVRNIVSAGSTRKVGRATKPWAPDISKVSASFTKRVKNSNMRMGSFPANVWFLKVRLRFLMSLLISVVPVDELVSTVRLSGYKLYKINLSNILSAGLIDLKPRWGGLIGLEWNSRIWL